MRRYPLPKVGDKVRWLLQDGWCFVRNGEYEVSAVDEASGFIDVINQHGEKTHNWPWCGAWEPLPKWQWWAGSDESWMTVGPCATREQVISEAVSDGLYENHDGFYVIEAIKGRVDLSAQFDATYWLEQAHERLHEDLADENGDGFDIITSADDIEALQKAVRAAISKWQAERRITVTTTRFTHTRNAEWVPVSTSEGEQ